MRFTYRFMLCVTFICTTGVVRADTDVCLKQDSCSCHFADGKVLNLTLLSSTNGTASFETSPEGDSTRYYFNPCTGFSGGCRQPEVAICQSMGDGFFTFTCGLQHTARFVNRLGYNGSDIFLAYSDGDDDRKSYIKLTCTNDTKSTFTYVSEAPIRTYNFELGSPCACPEKEAWTTTTTSIPTMTATPNTTSTANTNSPFTSIPTTTVIPARNTTCAQKDACTCEMSDGTGTINLRSLNKPEMPLEHLTDNVGYYYNPCSGFNLSSHSPMNTCIDVSVCEAVYAGEIISDIRVIGDPHTARISTKPDGTVVVHYHAPGNKKSDVHLICDRSAREQPIFRYLHEHSGKSIFSLRSVCACPGGCTGPTRKCEPTDSCSCTYSDGSGTVNLHPLNNPYAPLKTIVYLPPGQYDYYYNPCSGIKLDGPCANVSACQHGIHENVIFEENSLGRIETQSFTTDLDDNLVLNYNGGTDGRTFTVALICDPVANVPVFGNPKEDPIKHYSFTLRSKCACPGMCSSA